ncbi:MAG: rhomboid family intramembrane serine protease, partial [Pseudomonadota bacterium]
VGTRIPLSESTACSLGGSSTWHTLVSSMFLHGSWFHLIGNMWFLWIFGNNVEDSMGHGRFIVFYLLCGIAAAGAQVIVDTSSTIPMVGASGAIGGVMGAYILLFPRVNVHLLIILGFYITTVAVPAVFMLGYWFVLQLVSGVGSLGSTGGGVAFWAHAGGFIAGAALVLLFRNKQRLARHPHHGWNAPGSRSFKKVDRRRR